MYRWYVLSMLALTYAFSVMDRQIMSILAQDIKLEFGLTDTQVGLLGGFAFGLLYAVLGVPIARLADRVNRVNIIAIAVGFWSLATALCGAATSYAQLFLARMGVGVGEAGGNAPSHSTISDYFEPERRGFAMSIYSLGTSVGGLLGLVVGGYVAQFHGWRWAFVVLGVPGILLALAVKLTIREPGRGAADARQPSAESTTSFRDAVQALLGNRVYRQVLIGHTLAVFVGYAIFLWLAILYLREFDLAQGEVGSIIGAVNLFAGVPGLLIGGYLVDRFGVADIRWRMRIPALALCFALPIYLAALWQTSWVSMTVFFSAGIFLYQASHAPGLAVVQSAVHPSHRALAASLVFLFANLFGLGAGPFVVGYLSDLFLAAGYERSLQPALAVSILVLLPAIYWYWRSATSLREAENHTG